MILFEVQTGENRAELLLAAGDAAPPSLPTANEADERGWEFDSAASPDDNRWTAAVAFGVASPQKPSAGLNTSE